jgi:hypothetical protein
MHHKIKGKLAAGAAAVAIGAAGGLAVASPAQAAYSDCAAFDRVACFHQYGDFTGQVWRQTTGQFPTGCRDLSYANFNDKASTAFNRTTNYTLRVYVDSGCTGSYVTLSPGEVMSFPGDAPWFDNRASSARLTFIG